MLYVGISSAWLLAQMEGDGLRLHWCGEVQEEPPNSSNAGKVIVVSTEKERKAWSQYAKYAKTVMEAGHLLTCVLKQEVAKGGKLE